MFTAKLALRETDCGSPLEENMSTGRTAPLEEVEDGVVAQVGAAGWRERGLGVEVAGVAGGGAFWSGVTPDPWEFT